MGFGVWGLGFGFGVWGLRSRSRIWDSQTSRLRGSGGLQQGFGLWGEIRFRCTTSPQTLNPMATENLERERERERERASHTISYHIIT